MEGTPLINIIGVKCRPEQEAKFNNWYNNVHIPMLMQYEGLKGAERYHTLAENPDYPNLIAFYKYNKLKDMEKQATEPFYAAVAADIKATWPEGRDIRWRATYFEHRRWFAANTGALSSDTVIHIVGVNGPSPEKDAEFNTWYDYTHVPWLMKTGTITQSVRYRIAQPNKEYPAYLAMYYFDNKKKYETFLDHPERLAAVKEMNEHWPGGIGSMWRVQYRLIKEWRK
jgi:hypothetical protein